MSWIPRPASPRAVVRDFLAFARQRDREHVIGAVLAFLVTLIIVIIFLVDPKVNTAPPEQVTYADIYREHLSAGPLPLHRLRLSVRSGCTATAVSGSKAGWPAAHPEPRYRGIPAFAVVFAVVEAAL